MSIAFNPGILVSRHVYAVRGDSMAPALRPGDWLLVDVKAYRKRRPSRGDVVVARDAHESGRIHVKRVVGLPAEEVRLLDGMLYINGAHLPEPYLGGLPASLGLGEARWRLGHDEYFLLGDNRAHSTDSRASGPARGGLIVGRAWLRCWPPTRWGAVRSCPVPRP